MMVALLFSVSLAGYGDAVDGLPSVESRAMHLWTDAVRTDPTAFDADYGVWGCSSATFSADEQTPKAPLGQHVDLVFTADLHNDDMIANNHFDHDSSDGTPMADRIWAYYSGWSIAENISLGYPSPRDAVFGWMCSSGHRSNLMSAVYTDYGGAWQDAWGTQNFGAGGGLVPGAVRTAVHDDEGGTIVFRASFGDSSGPASIDVVLDGVAHPMALSWGTDDNGIYSASVADPGAGCHEYYVQADVGGTVVTYPETGSYGWGTCAFDDADAQWIDGQLPVVAPPGGPLLVTDPWVAGGQVELVVEGAVAGTTVHFVMGTAVGNGPCPPALGGLCLEVAGNARKLGDDVADANGVAVLPYTVPAGASGATVHLQGIVDAGAGWELTPIVSESIQ
jgi:hypothetical protein